MVEGYALDWVVPDYRNGGVTMEDLPAGWDASWSHTKRKKERAVNARIIDMTAIDLVAYGHRPDVAGRLTYNERILAVEKLVNQGLHREVIKARLGADGQRTRVRVHGDAPGRVRARIDAGELHVSGGLR